MEEKVFVKCRGERQLKGVLHVCESRYCCCCCYISLLLFFYCVESCISLLAGVFALSALPLSYPTFPVVPPLSTLPTISLLYCFSLPEYPYLLAFSVSLFYDIHCNLPPLGFLSPAFCLF